MARRGITIFNVNTDDPAKAREIIIDEFPDFFKNCLDHKEKHYIRASALLEARFDRDYDMTLNEFAIHYYYSMSDYGLNKPKYERRKLGVSKSSDT